MPEYFSCTVENGEVKISIEGSKRGVINALLNAIEQTISALPLTDREAAKKKLVEIISQNDFAFGGDCDGT